jgi:membrane fusion protein, multidrug efflux system
VIRARYFVFALAPLLVACHGKTAEGTAHAGRGDKSGLTFPVDTFRVEAKRVPYVIAAPGTIEAFERVQVTARVAGAIDRVAFSEGQEVKKGDVLVVIDSERFGLAVNGAKAALDKADAALEDSTAMVKRREGATKDNPGLIPGEELATYKTKERSAKADRESAVQDLRTAQLNLRDSQVRAPIEGVIQTRTVETGQYVQAGYVMATLLRSDPLLLRFQVEPGDAPRLKTGMNVGFTMRETQRKYVATIRLVAAAADASHMVSVTGDVQEVDHKYWLRPGSFCDVNIELDAQRDVPVIPRSAARATDHGYVAYVVDGGVAHERVVALGMSTKDGWVEVRSGLAGNDVLVVRGAEALAEGAKVQQTEVTADSLHQADAAAAASAAPPPPASANAPPPPPVVAAPPQASASSGARR